MSPLSEHVYLFKLPGVFIHMLTTSTLYTDFEIAEPFGLGSDDGFWL